MRNISLFALILALLYGNYAAAAGTVGTVQKKQFDTPTIGEYGVSLKAVSSAPSGDIANVYNGAIGVELTPVYRNFLFDDFDVSAFGSYFNYTGKANSSNSLTTINLGVLGRYNFRVEGVPGVVFAEAGGGFSLQNQTIAGIGFDNIDPIYRAGAGYEVNIAENINLLAGLNYNYLPEKGIAGATRDGSFFNICLGVSYEFYGENRRKK